MIELQKNASKGIRLISSPRKESEIHCKKISMVPYQVPKIFNGHQPSSNRLAGVNLNCLPGLALHFCFCRAWPYASVSAPPTPKRPSVQTRRMSLPVVPWSEP